MGFHIVRSIKKNFSPVAVSNELFGLGYRAVPGARNIDRMVGALPKTVLERLHSALVKTYGPHARLRSQKGQAYTEQ